MVAMRSGMSLCVLSTWKQQHEDEDFLDMFK